jgi:hypothetical protein
MTSTPTRQPLGLYRTLTRNLSMGAVFALVCSPRSFACVGCLMQSVCAAADARETVRPHSHVVKRTSQLSPLSNPAFVHRGCRPGLTSVEALCDELGPQSLLVA